MIKNKRFFIPMVSLLLWIIFISIGYVSYDVNDDASLNLISAGALGVGQQYLIYTNVLLGWILRILFSWFPQINCYLWFYLVLNLIAVIAICLVVSDNMKPRTALFTTIGINLLVAGEFYVHITYTKSAALYGTAGLVLLFWQVKKKERDTALMILAFCLITIGTWARWKSFALCVPIVIGIELLEILVDVFVRKRICSLKRYFPVVVAGAICIASILIDNLAYKMNSEWDEFRKTDNLLIEMRDNNRYVFGDSPDEYLAAGITENDFKMIKGYWMWNDPQFFNSERLQQIKAIGSKYENPTIRFDVTLVKDCIKEILWILTGKSYGIIFVIIVLISSIYGNKTLLLKVAYISIVAAGEIYYMFCLNRVLWRAELCTILTATIAGAYLLSELVVSETEEKTEKKVYPYIPFVVVCLTFILVKSVFTDNTRLTNGDSQFEDFQKLTDSDSFFVVQDISKYGMLLGAKDIFDITRTNYKDYYDNIVELGGTSQSPAGMHFASLKGINNPIKDMIDGENIYFVGDEEPRLVLAEFMEEKYGPGLTWEPVNIDGIAAYQVTYAK